MARTLFGLTLVVVASVATLSIGPAQTYALRNAVPLLQTTTPVVTPTATPAPEPTPTQTVEPSPTTLPTATATATAPPTVTVAPSPAATVPAPQATAPPKPTAASAESTVPAVRTPAPTPDRDSSGDIFGYNPAQIVGLLVYFFVGLLLAAGWLIWAVSRQRRG